MENLEHKSLLAKLLAQENINIIHSSSIRTAYFDLETRTIYIPKWSDISNELIDMLEGHEVGHAMFTPKEGWHDAVEKNHALKSYLNVLEDVRIERKIKNMYPGLRFSFNTAYKQLHDRDFFGLADYKIKDLIFIDRINIFYKLGGHVRVPFSAEETVILNRINKMETWEDVESLAQELLASERKKQKDTPKEEEPEDSEDFEDSMEQFEYSPEDDSDESDEEESEDSEDESEEEDESEDESDEDDQSGESEEEDEFKENDSDLESVTDRNFRNNENSLVDNSKISVTAMIPIFEDRVFISWKAIHDDIDEHIEKIQSNFTDYAGRSGWQTKVVNVQKFIKEHREEEYKNFLLRSNDMVNYMVKEFEMRKNASQLSRTRVSKSGQIDAKKLSRYSISSDIFKRISTVKEGKSHGLVIFIDLSGSMQEQISSTFEQAIAMTLFCKKVGIPFDVYGFSDNPGNEKLQTSEGQKYPYKDGYLALNMGEHFNIKHYLSSKMNKLQHMNACMNMLFVAKMNNPSHKTPYSEFFIPQQELLHGTPLDSAIVASIQIVKQFKTGYNLDLVNCIFLTDGESPWSNNVIDTTSYKQFKNYTMPTADKRSDTSFYVQYPNTNIRVKYNHMCNWLFDPFCSTRALIEVAKQVTGCKYTGYFIADRKTILHRARAYDGIRTQKSDKTIRKDLLDNKFVSSTKFGFDEYFMVVNEIISITTSKMTAPTTVTKNALYKVFSNSIRSQNSQRIFLNKFMQNIAA